MPIIAAEQLSQPSSFQSSPPVPDCLIPGGNFLVRRKLISFPHTYFHICDSSGNRRFECKKKGFKLKEELILKCCQSGNPVLTIKARSIIDLGATYDVWDNASGCHIGSLRRHGIASIARDKWSILCPEGNAIGEINEDSLLLAMVRRLITTLLPQSFSISHLGHGVANIRQNFNFLAPKATVETTPGCQLDQRVLIAAVLLLMAIEGRQG